MEITGASWVLLGSSAHEQVQILLLTGSLEYLGFLHYHQDPGVEGTLPSGLPLACATVVLISYTCCHPALQTMCLRITEMYSPPVPEVVSQRQRVTRVGSTCRLWERTYWALSPLPVVANKALHFLVRSPMRADLCPHLHSTFLAVSLLWLCLNHPPPLSVTNSLVVAFRFHFESNSMLS